MSLFEPDRKKLLEIARASIEHGLAHGEPLPLKSANLSADLRAVRATFVTLNLDGLLRGCIGSLQAHLPLAEDVSLHAFEAAFEDPRFSNVVWKDIPKLEIHISVLSPMQPLPFTDEQDLLQQLRPGKDGLVIDDGHRRATFLPSVWAELPNPELFLSHLKRKAGIREDRLSATLQAYRYETECFS
jgi:AmmeMemoRadiSam system protein A